MSSAVSPPVLIGDFMLPPGSREKNLYAVVNDYTTHLIDDEAVRPSVIGVAQKAVTELVRELTDDTLHRGYILTRNANAKFGSPPFPTISGRHNRSSSTRSATTSCSTPDARMDAPAFRNGNASRRVSVIWR